MQCLASNLTASISAQVTLTLLVSSTLQISYHISDQGTCYNLACKYWASSLVFLYSYRASGAWHRVSMIHCQGVPDAATKTKMDESNERALAESSTNTIPGKALALVQHIMALVDASTGATPALRLRRQHQGPLLRRVPPRARRVPGAAAQRHLRHDRGARRCHQADERRAYDYVEGGDNPRRDSGPRRASRT